MKKTTLLVAAILSAAILAACSALAQAPAYTSTDDGIRVIDENTAKRAAMEHAGQAETQVEFTKVLLDKDDGRYEYDVEFVYDGYEYEFEINAEDGKVLSFEKEPVESKRSKKPEDATVPNEPTENTASKAPDSVKPENDAPSNDYVGEDKALSAALQKADLTNVNKDLLLGLRIKLDSDDRNIEYDVDFIYNGYEYDFEIDAKTGVVTKYEKERSDDYIPPLQEDSDLVISLDEANEIAFAHAGISLSDAYGYEWELDKDITVWEYEIEFKHDRYEYSYEIDGANGNIIRWEKELDD